MQRVSQGAYGPFLGTTACQWTSRLVGGPSSPHMCGRLSVKVWGSTSASHLVTSPGWMAKLNVTVKSWPASYRPTTAKMEWVLHLGWVCALFLVQCATMYWLVFVYFHQTFSLPSVFRFVTYTDCIFCVLNCLYWLCFWIICQICLAWLFNKCCKWNPNCLFLTNSYTYI